MADLVTLTLLSDLQDQINSVQKLPGPHGIQGLPGRDGTPGSKGEEGAQGPQGVQGVEGATGPAGADGVDGEQGVGVQSVEMAADGDLVFTFTDGNEHAVELPMPSVEAPSGQVHVINAGGGNGGGGVTGLAGATGPAGADGTDGADGATGPAGADGATGPAGADGATGPAGADGSSGGISEILKTFMTANATINASTSFAVFSVLNTTPAINLGGFSVASNGVTVPTTGYYQCTINAHYQAAVARSNVPAKFSINGTLQPELSASSYIRNANGHQESSVGFTTIYSLSANDVIGVAFRREANAGTVNLQTDSFITLVRIA